MITIGIATLNGADRLDRLLASLREHTSSPILHRILVIDDGSRERFLIQHRALCKAHDVELQEHRINCGISATWNHLAERYADAETVVLLNDDVEVKRGWLEAITYFLDNNEYVGTVGLHPLKDDKIVVCGGGAMALDSPDASVPHRVVAANGYCFGFKRDLWKRIGGFDEGYMSFYEEVDFGVRLWREGFQSWNIPWPLVEHEWGSTFQQNAGTLLPQIRMQASKERFIEKWGHDLPEAVTKLKETPAVVPLRWLTEAGPVSGERFVEVAR